MISKLITLVFFFIVGWVVYTQFFGTEEEQEMGQEVISNAKETVKGIVNIFQHESGKIKEGTYDESIDKLGGLLDKLRAENKDASREKELVALSEETSRLKKEVQKVKEGEETIMSDDELKEDLKKLMEKSQKLVETLVVEEKK